MNGWAWVLVAVVVLLALPLALSAPELARYLRIRKM